jgi:hypothetical protein
MRFFFVTAILVASRWQATSFNTIAEVQLHPKHHSLYCNNSVLRSAPENIDDATLDEEAIPSSENRDKAALLKRELYQLAASYDRGFSATPKARRESSEIIERLAAINPTKDASRGINGDTYNQDVPLKAVWRMIWTSALDVVSLGASPLAGEFYATSLDRKDLLC